MQFRTANKYSAYSHLTESCFCLNVFDQLILQCVHSIENYRCRQQSSYRNVGSTRATTWQVSQLSFYLFLFYFNKKLYERYLIYRVHTLKARNYLLFSNIVRSLSVPVGQVKLVCTAYLFLTCVSILALSHHRQQSHLAAVWIGKHEKSNIHTVVTYINCVFK